MEQDFDSMKGAMVDLQTTVDEREQQLLGLNRDLMRMEIKMKVKSGTGNIL